MQKFIVYIDKPIVKQLLGLYITSFLLLTVAFKINYTMYTPTQVKFINRPRRSVAWALSVCPLVTNVYCETTADSTRSKCRLWWIWVGWDPGTVC